MKYYFQKAGIRRICMMLFGNVILGLGVGVFKLSMLGNDPFDGMNMALADLFHIYYPWMQIMVNVALFVIQLAFGRALIGLGTIVNAVFLGYIVNFFYWLFSTTLGTPQQFMPRLIVMLCGVAACSLGLSFYQTSDLGVAPYDSMALILSGRFRNVSYFWFRILCDGLCTLICFLAGSIVGLGTLAAAFGFGPMISLFNRTVSKPLLQTEQKGNAA